VVSVQGGKKGARLMAKKKKRTAAKKKTTRRVPKKKTTRANPAKVKHVAKSKLDKWYPGPNNTRVRRTRRGVEVVAR
jgi:hypothetical protein